MITLALRGNLSFLDRNDVTKHKKVLLGHQATFTGVTVDPITKFVYTADLVGRVCRYEGKSCEADEFQGKGHTGNVMEIGVNCDGTRLVTAGVDDYLIFSECKGHEYGYAILRSFLCLQL